MPLRWGAKLSCLLVSLQLLNTSLAQTPAPAPRVPAPRLPPSETRVPDLPVQTPPIEDVASDEGTSWLDSSHRNLHALLWRSAMNVDRWFGGDWPAHSYADQTRGSITPIVLWDEFSGFDEKLRFRVKLPLPYIGEKFNAFAGTFAREEFVTEREQASGAIPRQRVGGRVEEDETLVGIQYRERKDRDRIEPPGGEFLADAGVRIRSPIDPFVKGGYRWIHDSEGGLRTILRETVFWQNSEKLGLTSRVDLEHGFAEEWLARWTASGTISQRTQGMRGYFAASAFRNLPRDRAVTFQLFTTVEFDANVPVEEYGIRVAYRKRIARDWLVLELRPSLTWPKDEPAQPRKASWGFGVGVEMFFGMDEFQGRPVTF